MQNYAQNNLRFSVTRHKKCERIEKGKEGRIMRPFKRTYTDVM